MISVVIASTVSPTETVILEKAPLGNWLTYFQEHRLVDLPVIPGSHNSATWRCRPESHWMHHAAFPFARQQHVPISDRLEAGIRFLDLRLRASIDSVQISHRFDTMYDFVSVLKTVDIFLKEQPTEFLVLYIRVDWDHRLDPEPVGVPCERRLRIQEAIERSGLPLAEIRGSDFINTRVRDVRGRAILLIPDDGSVLSCSGLTRSALPAVGI